MMAGGVGSSAKNSPLQLLVAGEGYLTADNPCILACFIIFRHRENIARIRNKSENVFNFGLNLTHQKHNI